jgi:hypothetical protein
VDGFDQLNRVESSAEPGALKRAALVACAVLRPSDKLLLDEVQKFLAQPATIDSVKVASEIVAAWWSTGEASRRTS